MRRLWIDPARLASDSIVIGDEDFHYLARVLRLGVGDELVLFDGVNTEAVAAIVQVGPGSLEAKVSARRVMQPSAAPKLMLIQGLAKGDKLDFIVQKATELGVARISPVLTARSRGQLDARRAQAKRERWQKIARAAARQSARVDVPEITAIVSWEAALSEVPPDALCLLFSPAECCKLSLYKALSGKMPADVALAIGPEGGFTNEEIELAQRRGFQAVGLGPRILRTETAALAALVVLGFVLGDLAD